ncbi:MAG: exodeoxyribonuclease VII small subunit [Desulforudis sp.]|nr:exodeoxyribonuclease VII small subunit [Clostridia bacterium]MDQ7790557.1 exodeoxyribonuclease VII small subunit [Clostridia bacterium]RJX18690.1 MAG: exodeoxyribonuclease VII small subunit [Desulforudis sp.]
MGERTFEESLKRLEEVVRRLEDGRIPLEDALDLYAEGVLLARRCHGLLEDAEQRIQTLSVNELTARPSLEGSEDPDNGFPGRLGEKSENN